MSEMRNVIVSVVEVDVQQHRRDSRPESLRPDLATPKVIDQILPGDGLQRPESERGVKWA